MSVRVQTILGSKIGTCMCHNPNNLGPLMEVCVCVRVWTSLMASPASVHVNRDSLDAILHGMQAKLMASTANNKHINGKTQLAIICGQSLILFFVTALQLLYWLHNMANLILLDLNH